MQGKECDSEVHPFAIAFGLFLGVECRGRSGDLKCAHSQSLSPFFRNRIQGRVWESEMHPFSIAFVLFFQEWNAGQGVGI